MCSVDPDSLMTPKETDALTGAPCRKCLSNPAKVVLQHKFPYCKECFVGFLTHKYRSSLGKSKMMKHGNRVLVAFSGSHSSICLLNLIKNSSIDDTRKKRIHTETEVVYVDDLALSNVDPQDRMNILSHIKEVVGRTGYPLRIAPFTDRLDHVDTYDIDSAMHQNISHSIEMKWRDMSLTSSMDFVSKLRLKILQKVAEKLKCNKIFLADTSDHVAVNVIANIALGRGCQLPNDIKDFALSNKQIHCVLLTDDDSRSIRLSSGAALFALKGFCDGRFGNILILRPLVECSKKEVLFYNRFMNLASLTLPALATMGDRFASIQKLSEQFIANLSDNFPSTVSTVVSTGAKLVNDQNSSGLHCSFCMACVDVWSPVSAQEASKVSSLVSNLGPKSFDPSTMYSKDGCIPENCVCTQKEKDSMPNPTLCYGCRQIANEAGATDFFIRQGALQAMRHEIEEFLL